MCRIVIIIFSLLPLTCLAQVGGGDIVKLAETVNRFNRVFPQEKVYLHLDNTGYFMGETIWLKAYMTRTDNDSLGSLSRVLYVELVGPYGDVVKTQKLKVEHGTAHGEIELKGLMTSGYYEVRAYTRYMLNWGREAIFSRVIPIFEKPVKEGDYSRPVISERTNERLVPSSREPSAEDAHRLNIHFYPEGGQMVSGLQGRVAFRLTDRQGKAVDGTCVVKHGGMVEGDVIETREGRGVFTLKPDESKAVLQVTYGGGRTTTFDIPAAEASGCVLEADVLHGDTIGLTLKASPDLYGRRVGVTWLQGGHMYHCEEVSLSASDAVVRMPRSDLRDGVNQVTVIDVSGQILAHRMVFAYPKHAVAGVGIETKNTMTLVGRKRLLEFQSRPNTTLSVSITDATTQTGGWTHNAATWLLLTSDLRGYIRHPEYYFESDDEEHRRAADLLMMVQGWRRYDFQTMEGKRTFEMLHAIEDRLYIDGKLNQYKRKKTVDGVTLGLLLTNNLGDQLAGRTLTGKNGHYAFAVPDCYREWDATILTMKDDKFEKYYVGINRHFSPAGRQLEADEEEPIELEEPSLVIVNQADESQKWKSDQVQTLQDEVQVLQEVKVTGRLWRNPRDFWERESRGARNATLWYDCGSEADKLLDQGQSVPTLISFLKEKNPLFSGNDNLSGSTSYTDNTYNFYEDGLTYNHRPVIWILNNMFFCATGMPAKYVKRPADDEHPWEKTRSFPVDLDQVKSVYISMERNDLRRFAPHLNTLGSNCVLVYVYSYHQSSTKTTKGIRLTHFEGFNVPKEYEEEVVTGLHPSEDFRRTLYWNPNVKTNDEGKATIEFLCRPSCLQMNVSAEALAEDGTAVVY